MLHQLLESKHAIAHNDVSIDLDGAAAGNNIHVDECVPVGPGKLWVGIAKGHVQAGHLLILEQIADQLFETRQGTDGELACAIAIGR